MLLKLPLPPPIQAKQVPHILLLILLHSVPHVSLIWVQMTVHDSHSRETMKHSAQLSSLPYRKAHQEPGADTKGRNSQDLVQEPISLLTWSSYLVVGKIQQTPRGCPHLRILSFAQGTLLSGSFKSSLSWFEMKRQDLPKFLDHFLHSIPC